MWHADFSSGAKSKKSLIYSSKDGTLFALNSLRVAFCAPSLPRVSSLSSTTESSSTDDSGPVGATDISHTQNATPMTPGDPRAIPLPESTKTLSVLFQFILPMPPPTLQDLNVDELVDILTAARKYKVYTVVSFGESRLLSLAPDDSDAEVLFVYGIKNKLPRFMDAGAPGVYRDVKREELLKICNEHGVLYAWNRYQLLWDRIIEGTCAVALRRTPHGKKEREIYKHYDNLRSLHWTNRWILSNNPKMLLGEPRVSYHEFLAMLEENTLTLPVENPAGNGLHSDSSLERVSIKHINDKIKEMIKEMPTFSSFLESSQKDGDIALGQDELDSSEEEEEEQQDGSG